MKIQSTNNPIAFDYHGQLLQTVVIDGEPWMVADDVCSILGYADTRQAVEKLDEDERMIGKIYRSSKTRDMWLVNESGLYTLIIRSNKPEAKPFRRWVTHEVLPSIRKTGQYSFTQERIVELYVREIGPYAPLFPKEYYYELHRLMGWDYDPTRTERSGYVGTLTNKLIYDCLPPGVLARLKEVNPSEGGRRGSKHHQFLSDEVGKKHLQKQIDFVVELAPLCSTMEMLIELASRKRDRLYGDGDATQMKFLQAKYELVGV